MIFHENRLLADDSHEISYLIFKMFQNLSSATVVIGAGLFMLYEINKDADQNLCDSLCLEGKI